MQVHNKTTLIKAHGKPFPVDMGGKLGRRAFRAAKKVEIHAAKMARHRAERARMR
jgi:hypothetical protein